MYVIVATGTAQNRELCCNYECIKLKMQNRVCGERDFEWPLKSFLLCKSSLLPAIHYSFWRNLLIFNICVNIMESLRCFVLFKTEQTAAS